MIHIVRRLRHKLLAQSAFRRYALYALGEILLVVVGILLALQINLWNQERELRKIQKLYLLRIQDDIQTMIAHTAKFEQAEEYLEYTLRALRIVEKCEADDEERAILYDVLANHQALSLFPIERTAYDEILSAGILGQIRNDSLKRSLSSLYARIESSQNSLSYFRDELGRASEVIMTHVPFTVENYEFSAVSFNLKEICASFTFRNALVEVVDARGDVGGMGRFLRMELLKTAEMLKAELQTE